MPLEQTDMNVGFNSGADKVIFSVTTRDSRTRTDLRISGSQAQNFFQLLKKHTFLVVSGNSLDRLSRNQ